MLVLYETPAGYALFKVMDEKKMKDVDDITAAFADSDSASKMLKLKAFQKFDDTSEALVAATSMLESSVSKKLKKFLDKNIVQKELSDELAVYETKLGKAINEKLDIPCIYNDKVLELMRGVRQNLETLLGGTTENDLRVMRLGLAHSLGRHKLKFSPDKVDTMVVQAIGLLDELDKELNTYAMRVREWYGWHFPEMGKVVTENVPYAKCAKKMGMRTNCVQCDFADILDEETEQELKEAVQISMGTEISDDDIANIQSLCDQVIALSEYRVQLYEYLQNRMRAIAPNLTTMVGELVGARLIAHAGSLMSLAKHPASTVQILGAEKALFRALKAKHDTPKYGLIYHASLIGQAAPKHKGKISRVLAAKCALSIRVDALTVGDIPEVGVEHRMAVENRLRQLEGGVITALSGSAKGKASAKKYNGAVDSEGAAKSTGGTSAASDMTVGSKEKKRKKESDDDEQDKSKKKDKGAKKAKKADSDDEEDEKPKKKKDKKKKKKESSDDDSD
jgi:nucleolar protein 58